MRRWIRRLGGIGLMAIAILGLIYWEYDGRERLLTDDILVARSDIEKDAIITSDMFVVSGTADDKRISGALAPDDLDRILASRSRQIIPANAQICDGFFYKDDFQIADNESVFVIKPEWISMISSSVRQRDRIRIYSEKGDRSLGVFKVAFVKDSTSREVKNTYRTNGENDTVESEGGSGSISISNTNSEKEEFRDILERTDATSVVDYIEIIATLEDYIKLLDCVTGEKSEKIMVVQE